MELLPLIALAALALLWSQQDAVLPDLPLLGAGAIFFFGVVPAAVACALSARRFLANPVMPVLAMLGGTVLLLLEQIGHLAQTTGVALPGIEKTQALRLGCDWVAAVCFLIAAASRYSWAEPLPRPRLFLFFPLVLPLAWILAQATPAAAPFPIPARESAPYVWPTHTYTLFAAALAFVTASVLLRAHHRVFAVRVVRCTSFAFFFFAIALLPGFVAPADGSLLDLATETVRCVGLAFLVAGSVLVQREPVLLQPADGKRPEAAAYVLGLVLVAQATVLRIAYSPFLHGEYAYITFYPAVIAIVLYGGAGPAIFAMFTSVLIVNTFLIPAAEFSLDPRTPYFFSLLLFLVSCLLIAWLGRQMRSAIEYNARLRESLALAEEKEHASSLVAERDTRIRVLMDQAPDGIFLVDAEGNFIDVNATGARMFGYDHGEILRRSVVDLVAPRERGRISAAFRSVASGSTATARWSLVRRDGSEIPVEVRGRQFGQSFTIVFVRDLTERTQMRARLRTSARRYMALANLVSEAIAVIREDRILEVNEQFDALTGTVRAALIGHSLLDFVAPEERVRLAQVLRGDQGGGDASFAFQRPDGQLRRVLVRACRADPADPRDAIASLLDVTEQESDNAVQRIRTLWMQTVHDALPAAFCVVDSDAVIVLANNAWFQFWLEKEVQAQVPQPMRLGANLLDAHVPNGPYAQFVGTLVASVRQVLDGTRSAVQAELAIGSAAQRWILLSIVRLPGQGGGAVITQTDISGTKRAEVAQHRLREGLAQILHNQVPTHVTAAIAHDLNQPLTAVTTFGEALRMQVQQGLALSPRVLHAINAMSVNAERAGDVLRQLMRHLRAPARDTEVFDVSTLVDEVVALVVSTRGPAARIEVHTPEAPLHASANRLQIAKVLQNLLENAAEAIAHSEYSVSGTTSVGVALVDGQVEVRVEDSGPGLAPHMRSRLFQAFSTSKTTGIGMGLALSKALVEENAGKLWYEAAPDHGCIFVFTLPRAEEDALK